MAPASVSVGVTVEPLDGARVLRETGGREDGAILVFEGRVRDHSSGKRVEGLQYEAFEEMANEVLAQIATEAAERVAVSRIVAWHRTGALQPGDVSLVVAVSAAHREPAFAAARYMIEELKRRLPVWKKERFSAGESAWVEGHPVEGE